LIAYRLGFVYVALSEGVRDKDGEFIGAKDATTDAFGNKAISLSDGPGAYLAKLISNKFGIKARVNRPGTIQRAMASLASETDVNEAFRADQAAEILCTRYY